LRQHLTLAVIDHRGFGFTNKPTTQADFELDTLVDDIEAFRQHLGFDKVIIIGHSGHGYMALEYAKKYADYVSKVVLIGMGPDQSPSSHAAANQYFDAEASESRKMQFQKDMEGLHEAIASDPENRFITFCRRFGARSWFDATFDAAPLWEGVTVNMQMFDYVWGKVFRDIDITKDIDKLKAPILLALGKYDFLVSPYSWDLIASKFKQLTIKLFEKSGHTPPLEESDLFDQTLLEWIASAQVN
jgi:proline iminopeptidase